jgi:hypothetical protein
MSQTVEVPQPDIADGQGTGDGEWLVIVFNNDHNTWDEVTGILQEATGCTLQEAEMETWEIDHLGRSIVHHADHAECERVAGIIRTIGIEVAVDQL